MSINVTGPLVDWGVQKYARGKVDVPGKMPMR